MANAINIPKTHLIMGLSLPLAVLLGYFVAEPMELGSMAVVVFVLAVLSIPLLMKWYYPVLVLCLERGNLSCLSAGRAPLVGDHGVSSACFSPCSAARSARTSGL